VGAEHPDTSLGGSLHEWLRDLDDPADADDVAALADLLVRRELRAPRRAAAASAGPLRPVVIRPARWMA
jgi:hypothetical protein